MDIYQIRVINLETLISEYGGKINKFSEAAEMSESYASQLRNAGKKNGRNMGNKTARKLEKALGLASGWMDTLHETLYSQAQSGTHVADSQAVYPIPTTPAPARVIYEIDQKRLERALNMVYEDVGKDWCVARKISSQARLIMMAYDRVQKHQG